MYTLVSVAPAFLFTPAWLRTVFAVPSSCLASTAPPTDAGSLLLLQMNALVSTDYSVKQPFFTSTSLTQQWVKKVQRRHLHKKSITCDQWRGTPQQHSDT
ncbi:hypothetical protein DNTS_017762 [Danionella cerebrum]|uniref:Secreted protein n=1 Tax=Danionella cerebrum TaxID=2873325 RepID=A0A553RCQ6_9TELE|nr:hypothetical protein DNTS_017762 [Danionella translucida]